MSEWSAEHKWDGIRSQVIIRNNELFVWSRGEELVTDKYPEFEAFVNTIPNGTVIDGEILPFPEGQIGTFKDLQTRIGRKSITKKLLEKTPVILKAYDILEWDGEDIRNKSFRYRREILEKLFAEVSSEGIPLYLSENIRFESWEEAAKEREKAREVMSEGLMLKRFDSPYLVGRKRRLVEMESRSPHHRCGSYVCHAWPRPAQQFVYRLYFRALG